MTDFVQLAADLGTTLDGAVRLAQAAWRGEPMMDREAGLKTFCWLAGHLAAKRNCLPARLIHNGVCKLIR
jgi:hypothetical protein